MCAEERRYWVSVAGRDLEVARGGVEDGVVGGPGLDAWFLAVVEVEIASKAAGQVGRS